MKRLHGKVALITGASRVMGESHARVFVEFGAKVIMTDVDEVSGAALARELAAVSREVQATTGSAPVIVGMDAYQIASEIAFYARPPYLLPGGPAAAGPGATTPLDVTAIGQLFGGDGLMFAYWNPPARLQGRTFVLVARDRATLERPSLPAYFDRMDPDIHALPQAAAGTGGERRLIDQVYYRIGHGYAPAPPAAH